MTTVTTPTQRKRTINMPRTRALQIALAGAHLGLSSEQTIQSFITAGLLSLASHDRVFRYALLRAAGVPFDDLAKVDYPDALAKLAP
jgi:hypothetical protein